MWKNEWENKILKIVYDIYKKLKKSKEEEMELRRLRMKGTLNWFEKRRFLLLALKRGTRTLADDFSELTLAAVALVLIFFLRVKKGEEIGVLDTISFILASGVLLSLLAAFIWVISEIFHTIVLR